MPGFSLPGIDGEVHTLDARADMPVAVLFSCCHCPYVIAWDDRISEIAADYADRAAVVAINANDHIGDTLWRLHQLDLPPDIFRRRDGGYQLLCL